MVMDFLMTYGWAIVVVVIILGVLAYWGIIPLPKQEKFNPELHECTENKTYVIARGFPHVSADDTNTCEPLFLSSNEQWGTLCQGKCVSWQLKQIDSSFLNLSCQQLVNLHNKRADICINEATKGMEEGYYSISKYENCYPPNEKSRILSLQDLRCEEELTVSDNIAYCSENPSDSEKCECVNSAFVESFEYGSINYSNIIEVDYWGYECKELIDDDSLYMLQSSRRRFVAAMPIRIERTYDCNLPCNDTRGCYFETKCFEPLNQSLLKYKGTSNRFPIYCSSSGNTMRVTANFTYGDGAFMRVNKQVCVEAVPKGMKE